MYDYICLRDCKQYCMLFCLQTIQRLPMLLLQSACLTDSFGISCQSIKSKEMYFLVIQKECIGKYGSTSYNYRDDPEKKWRPIEKV